MIRRRVFLDVGKLDELKVETVLLVPRRFRRSKTHGICRHNLQVRVRVLQQLLHHLQERLDEEIQRLSVTSHQQQVHRFHRDLDKSENVFDFKFI